jgi:cation:H+ antiporter
VSARDWLVDGAVAIASALGVSELIIGLTIIAAGTSLPEVATSIVAGLRGERDIAVGNVVGSNLFNILVVVGATALDRAGGLRRRAGGHQLRHARDDRGVGAVPADLLRELPDRPLGRRAVPVLLRLLHALPDPRASQHDALPAFSAVMSYIVIPRHSLTVALAFGRELLRRRRRRAETA